MESKTKEGRSAVPDRLSYSGGGKVSVPVDSIVSSPKVQRQVNSVREIAANQATNKPKS